jgi:hypothetical protein
MKRALIVLTILALAIVAAWEWFTLPESIKEEHEKAHVPKSIAWLDTGLTIPDQEVWHHLSEGSELMPMSFLEALRNTNTGKPFIESLASYGFLVESEDPHHLPVGWTMQMRDFGGRQVPFIGINCAACHSGEIRFKGASIRIDGAPNLFALEGFFNDLQASVEAMRSEPVQAFLFVREVIRRNHDPRQLNALLKASPDAVVLLNSVNLDDGLDKSEKEIVNTVGAAFAGVIDVKDRHVESHPGLDTNNPSLTPAELKNRSLMRELVSSFRKDEAYIERRLATFGTLSKAIRSGVDMGPGRGDSFGIIRDLLFPTDQIRLDGPVSTPSLFDFKNFKWIHWDGNSTSVMDRNIAQAIALGADFDPVTGISSVLPRNLYKLEQVASKITAPRWPEEMLGRIDTVKAKRGEALFSTHCRECHTKEGLHEIARIGTSPHRAMNFAEKMDGLPFFTHLETIVARAKGEVYKAHSITPEHARAMERVPDPTWRATHGYIARPLKGVWATAPYLHNGSVPTLSDLLRPAAKRPKQFHLGTRDFDPTKVGYVEDSKKGWLFDTTIVGNENAGHEFATDLTEESRFDLVEYLKTL